jgi:hypothetical protein
MESPQGGGEKRISEPHEKTSVTGILATNNRLLLRLVCSMDYMGADSQV